MQSCFGFPASASGASSRRSSVRLSAAVAAAFGCCASWSVGTSRRRHVRIDRPVYMSGGACFCGVLCSSRACAVPAASTSSAASGRCSRLSPPRGLVEGLLLPELLLPSCSCRFTATVRSPFQRTPSTAWLRCGCLHLGDCLLSELTCAFDVVSLHGKDFALLFFE